MIILTSCVSLHIGINDPFDNSRYSYINTDLWISVVSNEPKPIDYYKNFDMKLYQTNINWGKYECSDKTVKKP